jgi:hypothetical protein
MVRDGVAKVKIHTARGVGRGEGPHIHSRSEWGIHGGQLARVYSGRDPLLRVRRRSRSVPSWQIRVGCGVWGACRQVHRPCTDDAGARSSPAAAVSSPPEFEAVMCKQPSPGSPLECRRWGRLWSRCEVRGGGRPRLSPLSAPGQNSLFARARARAHASPSPPPPPRPWCPNACSAVEDRARGARRRAATNESSRSAGSGTSTVPHSPSSTPRAMSARLGVPPPQLVRR